MSDSEKKIVSEDREKKRSLPSEDSDDHASDSEDRRHKRPAVNDSNSSSPQRPQHRRRPSTSGTKEGESDGPPTTAIRSIVSTKDAGVIIGKSGKNVSEIREKSGAKVTISEMVQGAQERILTVLGPLDTVAKAYSLVAQKIIAEHIEPDAVPETESTTVRLLVSHHRTGSVIGKGGAKIKEIQEESGARLVASEDVMPGSTERTITITGVPDAIHIAVYHVGMVLQEYSERDRNANVLQYRPQSSRMMGGYPGAGHHGGHGGYGGGFGGHGPSHHQPAFYGGGSGGYAQPPPMSYGQDFNAGPGGNGGGSGGPGSQAQQIFIPNDMVGCVIGKGGSKINEIRQMSGSHIKIAEPHGNTNERLVTITGTPESNEVALYMLYSRLESEKARAQ